MVVNKYFLAVTLLLQGGFLIAQVDTINVFFAKKHYEQALSEYISGKSEYRFISEMKDYMTIPILFLDSIKTKEYECGNFTGNIIDFNPKDFTYQYGIFFVNTEYKLIFPRQTTFSGEDISKMFPIVFIPNNYLFSMKHVYSKIFEYIKKTPNTHVFAMNEIEGYWMIKNEKLYYIAFNVFGGIHLIPAQKRFNYGKEFIRDISRLTFRSGYLYPICRKKNRDYSKYIFKLTIDSL